MDRLAETLSAGQEFGYPLHVIYYLAGMAGVAMIRGRFEVGARLYGAFEAQNRTTGTEIHPTDQVDFDRYLEMARTALGEAALDAARREGAGWTREQAIDESLALRA